ncbi:MAG: hypothetical protein QG629_711 [Patescibacteria group bacterium]|nr:hypothetical protein [Patescibacteria group bacterium]
MKIGLICPYSLTKGGGVQEVVKELSLEMTRLGHEVAIITPQPKEPYVDKRFRVIFLGSLADFKSPTATTVQVSASVLTDDIDAVLEREQFDVLHFHEPWIPVLSRQILARSNTVNVATFHAKLPETMASRAMAKIVTPYTKPLLKYIDTITAVSPAAAEYVGTLTDDEIVIVPNGINLRDFRVKHEVKPKDSKKTVLYVGRLEKRNGVKYLLLAHKELLRKMPDVQLLLAGDGVDRLKLERMVEELEINNVEFLGFVSDKEKKRLLASADLFCSPALFGESFGIVLLESMASGLVTVAGNNPGYESVMSGLGQLSLVNPRDTSEFADRLHLLLTDQGLRALWQKWAKKHVAQFDYNTVARQYLSVYESACAKPTNEIRAKRQNRL